jgi:predicted lipoprotein with Yx(FWY)xxD motif
MRYVTVGADIRIYYEDHGSGQPAVLIHGYRSARIPGTVRNASCWRPGTGHRLRPARIRPVQPAYGGVRLRHLCRRLEHAAGAPRPDQCRARRVHHWQRRGHRPPGPVRLGPGGQGCYVRGIPPFLLKSVNNPEEVGVAVAGVGGPTGAGPPAGPAATAVLKTTTINGTTVLTNGKGLTLCWFAPDTPAWSVCTGACAQYWPPVTGPATAGQGVTGTLGTITRSDGTKQATLRRAPAAHLHRRHRPRPGSRQQPQPERRPVARSHGVRLSPPAQALRRDERIATYALWSGAG